VNGSGCMVRDWLVMVGMGRLFSAVTSRTPAKPGMPGQSTPVAARGAYAHAKYPLVIGLLAVLLPGEATQARQGGAILEVETIPIRYQNAFVMEGLYVGRLQARQSSLLGFSRAGRVMSIAVDEGMAVDAGQKLAQMDARALQKEQRRLSAQLALREAQLTESRANLQFARDRMARFDELMRTHTASREDFDEAKAKLTVMQARVKVTEAELLEARARLEVNAIELQESDLYAPYAGVISERRIDEGSFVSAGAPVLRLTQVDALQAKVGIPHGPAAQLQAGQAVRFRIAGAPVEGRFLRLIPTHDPQTLMLNAIFAMPDHPPSLFVGQEVRLQLPREISQRGAWVPLGALKRGPRGLWYLYRLQPATRGAGYRIEQTICRLLHTDGERVYVGGTMADGDQVVASGIHRLVPGQLVRIHAASVQP
jgi:RND family efflux transporter MFP subunit